MTIPSAVKEAATKRGAGGAALSAGLGAGLGAAFALFAAALYGMNIPAARIASQAGLPGADLVAWRALLLLPILGLAARVLGTKLWPGPSQRMAIFRLALAASLTATFYLSALDHLPVPIAVVLFYTFPLLVMLLSNQIAGRRISRRQLGLFAAAFTGLIFAVGPSLGGLSPLGIALALAGALSCAFMFLFAESVEAAPLRVSFWTQAMMAPVAFAFAWLNGGPAPMAALVAAPIATAIAMLAYGVAFLFQLMASSRLNPSRVSLLFLFEPVTAILIAWIVLGETLSLLQSFGLVLILAALALEFGLAREKTPQPAP